MTDVFRGEAKPAEVPSEVESESEVEKVQPNVGTTGGARGVFRKEEKVAVLKGRKGPSVDVRKFRYDRVRGEAAKLPFELSRDDRMAAVDAGNMLHKLHVVFGVARESEGVLLAFDRALFFSHSVNGGSVLIPGRSSFSVPGVTREFSYAEVRDVLGVDQRRFFRTFADDITDVNKKVIADYDPYDAVKSEQWGWLNQIAYERGMHRFPYLIHDSADACLKLSPAERAALSASKVMVIATSNNSADKLKANNRVASADGYDSVVGL